jgi:hypothetical protein
MDNSKELYNKLSANKLYTKSYDEFTAKYGTPEGQKTLFNKLKSENLYTKSEDDFIGQYWADDSVALKKKDVTASSGQIPSTVGKSDKSIWDYGWSGIKAIGAITGITELPAETTRIVGDMISLVGGGLDLGGRYTSAGINYLAGNKEQAKKDIESSPDFLAKYLVDAGEYISKQANVTKTDNLKSLGVSEKNLDPNRTFFDAFSEGEVLDGVAMLHHDVLATVPQFAAAMLTGGASLEANALRVGSSGLLKESALASMAAIPKTGVVSAASKSLQSQRGGQFKFGLGLGTSSNVAEEYRKDNNLTATDFIESLARGTVEGISETLFDTDIKAAKSLLNKFVDITDNPAYKGILNSIASIGEKETREKIIRTSGDILKKTFAGGRNEGFEEIAASYGNLLVDATKAGGFNQKDFDKFKKNAVESFIVGALSGGTISGVSAKFSQVKLTDEQNKTIDRYKEIANNEDLSEDTRNIAKKKIKEILDYNADLNNSNYNLIANLPKEKRAEVLDYLSKIDSIQDDKRDSKDLSPELDETISEYQSKVNSIIEEEQKIKLEEKRKSDRTPNEVDLDEVVNFYETAEQGKEIASLDNSLTELRNKISQGEEIEQSEIEGSLNTIYEMLDKIQNSTLTESQKAVAQAPLFDEFDKLEAYDKTVKTTETTTPITEKTTTTRKVGTIERPKVTISSNRFDLEPIRVTAPDGKVSDFVARVGEDGSISLKPKVKFTITAPKVEEMAKPEETPSEGQLPISFNQQEELTKTQQLDGEQNQPTTKAGNIANEGQVSDATISEVVSKKTKRGKPKGEPKQGKPNTTGTIINRALAVEDAEIGIEDAPRSIAMKFFLRGNKVLRDTPSNYFGAPLKTLATLFSRASQSGSSTIKGETNPRDGYSATLEKGGITIDKIAEYVKNEMQTVFPEVDFSDANYESIVLDVINGFNNRTAMAEELASQYGALGNSIRENKKIEEENIIWEARQRNMSVEDFKKMLEEYEEYGKLRGEVMDEVADILDNIQDYPELLNELNLTEEEKVNINEIFAESYGQEAVNKNAKPKEVIKQAPKVESKKETVKQEVAPEQKPKSKSQPQIDLDTNFLEYQESVFDEQGNVVGAKLKDTRTGNILEISNPDLAIDLALRAKQEKLGNVSEGIMEQEVSEVQVGEFKELLKEYINNQKAKKEQSKQETPKQEEEKLEIKPNKGFSVTDKIREIKNSILNKLSDVQKSRIINYSKALRSVSPDAKIILYENEQDLTDALLAEGVDATKASKAGTSRGIYNPNTNTVHLNATKLQGNTLPHEIFHAVVSNLAKSNPAEFAKMKAILSNILSKSEVKELNRFAELYKKEGESIQNEEWLSELASLITMNQTKLSKTFLQDLALGFKQFIKNIAKKINSKSLEGFADSLFKEATGANELINFFEGFANSLQQGKDINKSLIDAKAKQGSQNIPQEIREQRVLPDPLKRSRETYDKKFKNTMGQIINFIPKAIFERNINIKKALEKNKLFVPMFLMYNKAGAGQFASSVKFAKAYNTIFKGLKDNQLQLLNGIIFLRRSIAIDENFDNRGEKRPKHSPHNDVFGNEIETTLESAKQSLDDIKDSIGEEMYNDLINRSDDYFLEFTKILEYKLDNNLIDQATYDLYKNYNYSPTQFLNYLFGNSIEEKSLRPDALYTRTAGISGAELKKIKEGSAEYVMYDAAKLLEVAMIATEVRVATNKALEALYEQGLAQNLDWIKEVNYEKDKAGNIRVNKKGEQVYETKPDKGFRVVKFKSKGGIEKAFQLKENLAKEFFDQELYDKSNLLYRTAQLVFGANILRATATGVNVSFVASNIFLDVNSQVALNNIYQGNAMKQYKDAFGGTFKTTWDALANKYGKENKELEDLIYEFGQNGGLMMTLTEEYSNKSKFLRGFTDFLGSIGNASEIGGKLTAYKAAKKRLIDEFMVKNGRNPDTKEKDDILAEAVYLSRNAMDYHRGGLWTKWFDGFVPYLNVRVQGWKNAVNYIKSNPKQFTYKMLEAGTFLMGLTLYNMWAAGDDYENDDNQQDLATKFVIFYPFKNEDGKRGKLEFSVPSQVKAVLNVFQVMAEGMYYNMKYGENSPQKANFRLGVMDKMSRIAKSEGSVLNNLPPVIKGLAEYNFNQDFYRGGVITKELGTVLPQDEGMTNKDVAMFYKVIGQSTGLSPIRMKKATEDVFAPSNPIIPFSYAILDKVAESFGNLDEKHRSKFNSGKYSDIPLAFMDKIVGRVYSTTDPNIKLSNNQELVDKINQEMGSKKQDVRSEMKYLIESKAPISKVNSYISTLDAPYQRLASDSYNTLVKKESVFIKSNLDEYMNIQFAANAEAKARLLYAYFPNIYQEGNEKLYSDLKNLQLFDKSTKAYYDKYYKDKGIK